MSLHEAGDHALELERQLHERDQLIERFYGEGHPDLAGILEACGEEIRFVCTCCGATKVCRTHCKKRWCPLCAPALAAERVTKCDRAVRAMRWPLRMTLTVRNVKRLDTAKLAWLLKCFRKLRRREPMKSHCKGGFVSLEITNRGKGWHPHLELIVDAEWLCTKCAPPSKRRDSERELERKYKAAATELREAWASCTGQRWPSVKTRRCYGAAGNRNATMEALKYSVKPGALLAKKGRASEVVLAMKGRRLFTGFGSCYRLKLDEPRSPLPCECGAVGALIPEFVADIIAKKSNSKWHYDAS